MTKLPRPGLYMTAIEAIVAGTTRLLETVEGDEDKSYTDQETMYVKIPVSALCLRLAYRLWWETRLAEQHEDQAARQAQAQAAAHAAAQQPRRQRRQAQPIPASVQKVMSPLSAQAYGQPHVQPSQLEILSAQVQQQVQEAMAQMGAGPMQVRDFKMLTPETVPDFIKTILKSTSPEERADMATKIVESVQAVLQDTLDEDEMVDDQGDGFAE